MIGGAMPLLNHKWNTGIRESYLPPHKVAHTTLWYQGDDIHQRVISATSQSGTYNPLIPRWWYTPEGHICPLTKSHIRPSNAKVTIYTRESYLPPHKVAHTTLWYQGDDIHQRVISATSQSGTYDPLMPRWQYTRHHIPHVHTTLLCVLQKIFSFSYIDLYHTILHDFDKLCYLRCQTDMEGFAGAGWGDGSNACVSHPGRLWEPWYPA